MAKTWLITGSSRGFGRVWATAALRRGDRVAATARDAAALEGLVAEFGDAVLPMALDVTDRTAVFDTVARAHGHFGQLDVVVNNAGYGHFGMVEEVTEQEARDQIETNVFGALWVTQAALPFLREQGSGHILQVSSLGGIVAFPNLGIYQASKWAVEGFSEGLAKEVGGFGIKVTLIEPGPFATDWGGPSARHSPALAAYQPAHDAMAAFRASMRGTLGDPSATAEAVLQIVDAQEPPLRFFLGDVALGIAEEAYEGRLAEWREWQPVAAIAQGRAQPA
jgi:NAD(P)-dependent dehydrogenase (short-subunit alcohol dehydrogenase family)